MKPAVFPLFCCPIMLSGECYSFSPQERSFFGELDYAENKGNSMSSNTRVLEAEQLGDLRQFIESQLQIYKQMLLRMRNDNEIYLTQSWTNISRTGQFHPRHSHPNSIISGVMFLSENPDNVLPPVRFHRSAGLFPLSLLYDDLNEFNADCREFAAETGRLVLFPSQVEHDVGINNSQIERISLSFNTFVRGSLGGDSQLTELQL